MRRPLLLHLVFPVCLILALTVCLAGPAYAAPKAEEDETFRSANSADISDNWKLAVAKYMEVINRVGLSDPTNPLLLRARTKLCRIYVLQKRMAQSEPIFQILIKTDRKAFDREPELLVDLDDLGEAYESLAHDQQFGYESLHHSLQLRRLINPRHPHTAETYRALSEYCRNHHALKESIEWCKKAIDIDKAQSTLKQAYTVRDYNSLTTLYMEVNDLTLAQQACQNGLTTLTKYSCAPSALPHLHLHLGRIYAMKGDMEKADQEFDLALKTMPSTSRIAKSWPGTIAAYRAQYKMAQKY